LDHTHLEKSLLTLLKRGGKRVGREMIGGLYKGTSYMLLSNPEVGLNRSTSLKERETRFWEKGWGRDWGGVLEWVKVLDL
jgi:hypothetical protein